MICHPSHTMHGNSLDAYASTGLNAREIEVLSCIRAAGVPLTDRQVADRLGKGRDYAQPRISDLIRKTVLAEVGRIACPVTNKRVRLVAVRQ